MGSIQIDESFHAAPPQVHSFRGILSDFDGTIVDSRCSIQALILWHTLEYISSCSLKLVGRLILEIAHGVHPTSRNRGLTHGIGTDAIRKHWHK
jgi:hypothetical protein